MKNKYLILSLTLIICLLFSSCNKVVDFRNESEQPTESVDISEEMTTQNNTAEEETTEFTIRINNKTEGTSDLKYIQAQIEKPENVSFGPFYMYENNLYYVRPINEEGVETENGKELHRYNMLTGEDETIYRFVENDVNIYDLYFNGKEFIWAQYTQYSPCDWAIYRMNIDEAIPYLISDYSEYNHRNLTHESVNLHITGNSVFWLYNAMDDVNDTTLYKYDIVKEELAETITLDAKKVVFDRCRNGMLTIHDEVETVDGIRETYYTFDENGREIDFNYEFNTEFNSDIMVWKGDYKLYVRDLEDNQLYELVQFLGHDFYILGKYVITESEGVIRSYYPGEQFYEAIIETGNGFRGIFDLNEETNELYCLDTGTKGMLKIINFYLEENKD